MFNFACNYKITPNVSGDKLGEIVALHLDKYGN